MTAYLRHVEAGPGGEAGEGGRGQRGDGGVQGAAAVLRHHVAQTGDLDQ